MINFGFSDTRYFLRANQNLRSIAGFFCHSITNFTGNFVQAKYIRQLKPLYRSLLSEYCISRTYTRTRIDDVLFAFQLDT